MRVQKFSQFNPRRGFELLNRDTPFHGATWIYQPSSGITFGGAATTSKDGISAISGDGFQFRKRFKQPTVKMASGAGYALPTQVNSPWASPFYPSELYITSQFPQQSVGMVFNRLAQSWTTIITGGLSVFTYVGSGGFTTGGTALRARTKAFTSAGGNTIFNSTASTQFVQNSVVSWTYQPSGGIDFGGVSEVIKEKVFQPSGGVTFSGASEVLKEKEYLPTGGIDFAGDAILLKEKAYTAVGGFNLAGSATTLLGGQNADCRRSAAGVPFFLLGPGVTPNAAKDAAWRKQSGWGYSCVSAGGGGIGLRIFKIRHWFRSWLG